MKYIIFLTLILAVPLVSCTEEEFHETIPDSVHVISMGFEPTRTDGEESPE